MKPFKRENSDPKGECTEVMTCVRGKEVQILISLIIKKGVYDFLSECITDTYFNYLGVGFFSEKKFY